MASSAILLLSLLLPQTVPAAEGLPAFDLGFAEADLVLIASPKGFAGDRIPVTVHSILKGSVDGQRLFILQPRSYGLHVRLPHKASPHLLFLKETPAGYLPLQRLGIQIPVPKGSRRERALLAFVQLLNRTAASKHLTSTRGMDSICRDLIRFTRSHTQAAPLLAQAALLTLARRPDLAPQIPANELQDLRRVLSDSRSDPTLRDLSARCLSAAKDPKLPNQLLTLLRKGEAKGLGPVFGRLLAAGSRIDSKQALTQIHKQAGPEARPEIQRALKVLR